MKPTPPAGADAVECEGMFVSSTGPEGGVRTDFFAGETLTSGMAKSFTTSYVQPHAFRNFLVSGQYHAYALITMRERGKGSK
jgi:hypothetical protein